MSLLRGILQKIGKPGEEATVLGFFDNFSAYSTMKGWTKYGQYLANHTYMEGAELNGVKPLIERLGQKDKGLRYPIYLENGQGITITSDDTPIIDSYIEKRKFKSEGHKLIPDDQGKIEKEFLVEVHNGVPFTIKTGPLEKKTFAARLVKFDISPIIAQIKTNPKNIGHTVSSEILSDAIKKKILPWEKILFFGIGLLCGWLILARMFG